MGEKSDKCIERMEGSFVKAIQELSKTQNEIFGPAMNSIKDEISTSVIKQLKPTIRDEIKSSKADIRKEITSSFKDMLSDQKSDDGTILREQMVEIKANHNTEVMRSKETYHQKMKSQIEKHRNKIESVMKNHETEARSLQTKYRREIDAVHEQHETEVKKLKHKMEEYESEILSLKLHSSRASEKSPGVQITGSGRRESKKISNDQELNAVHEQHETEVKKLKHKMEEYESEILSLKLHSSRASEKSPGVQITGSGRRESKEISNDQELIQSDPTSCPQNQKGNN